MRAAIALLLLGCQGTSKDSCAELEQYAPAGVTLGTSEPECARLLAFADTVQARYAMDFRAWLSTVAPQRVVFASDTVLALTGPSAWTPRSFGPIPAQVPCGKGVPVTDELWSPPLSQILRTRPTALYVSLAVEIPPPGDMAAVRVSQDFNCDQKLGVTELVGEFHTGLPLMRGGWKLVSSKVSTIDE
jgi:hypothetical protein